MQQERRRSERVRVDLNTQWKSEQATREGTVVDISLHGCFIATQDDTSRVGDFIEVEIRVPSVLRMDLRGIVAHKIRGRGFAVRFKDLTGTEQSLLQMLLKMLKQRAPSPAA
jgi:PilZ domain